MKLQFPANQDATFVGASIPREVGHADSIRMISPFRVTGSVTNEAIQSLIALRWLNLTAPGNVIQVKIVARVYYAKLLKNRQILLFL